MIVQAEQRDVLPLLDQHQVVELSPLSPSLRFAITGVMFPLRFVRLEFTYTVRYGKRQSKSSSVTFYRCWINTKAVCYDL